MRNDNRWGEIPSSNIQTPEKLQATNPNNRSQLPCNLFGA
jgi:hypothetical protein